MDRCLHKYGATNGFYDALGSAMDGMGAGLPELVWWSSLPNAFQYEVWTVWTPVSQLRSLATFSMTLMRLGFGDVARGFSWLALTGSIPLLALLRLATWVPSHRSHRMYDE